MLSVIVCTRNRATQLEECLLRFRALRISRDMAWELLVVDNHSEDDTRNVVRVLKQASDLPIKYVFEEHRGLSYARNRGIREAKHQLIAFTDDDCLVHQNWIASILAEFAKDSSLSILGGRVELADPQDRPVGIRPCNTRSEVKSIDQLQALMIGCNMVFTRQVFETVGSFDPCFGKGTSIGSAEDIDLLYRALRRDFKIAFSPDVLVYHAHGRRAHTVEDSVNSLYVRGRGAFYCKHILRGDKQILQTAYWEVRALIKALTRGRSPAGSRALACKQLRELITGALFVSCRASGLARM